MEDLTGFLSFLKPGCVGLLKSPKGATGAFMFANIRERFPRAPKSSKNIFVPYYIIRIFFSKIVRVPMLPKVTNTLFIFAYRIILRI